MICIVGFNLLLLYKGMLCEKVTQSSPDKIVESGSEVTLPCTYDSEYIDPDLYWYRIRPDRSFQFVLYRDNIRVLDADFTQGRFSVQRSHTHQTFNLVISSVRTEDRATYYCAINPHGDAGAQEVCT
ncbi:T cell receptor delta variable 3 [Phyllostomus discolor]|nr:T cell receptor delta variable 3 [Phyllostomus discolor]